MNEHFSVDIPLSSIRVATPCRADWNKMTGDDRARFCQSCQKNVYNISEMSRAEAETLIRDREGNLCVRYYQRADGTILTSDCPVGITPPRKMKFSLAILTMLFAPILAMGGAMATTHVDRDAAMNTLRSTPVIGAIIERFSPSVSVVAGGLAIAPTQGRAAVVPPMMGAVAICPTPQPTPKPTPQLDATQKSTSVMIVMGEPLPPQAIPQAENLK